jgi:NAD-dependent deacetylase
MSDRARAIAELAERLKSAQRVAVLTGAGVSAESGLRTFRGVTAGTGSVPLPEDMAALWKEFDPTTLATPEAFAADPAMVSRWYDWRRLGCLAAVPNPGHVALAALEGLVSTRGGKFWMLTQNVDRLHQRAGSRNVVELHGNILVWRCTRTGAKVELPPSAMREFPIRSEAGGLLRPDVVWFGEMLPPEAIARAQQAAEECDVFLSVGTSAQVYPAAGFIREAHASGAFTAEINAEPTPISSLVDVCIHARAGEVLPDVIKLVTG